MKRRRGKMKKLISGLIVLVMITAFMTGSVFAAAPGELEHRHKIASFSHQHNNRGNIFLFAAECRAINWRGNFRRFICNCDCLAGLLYIWHGSKGV